MKTLTTTSLATAAAFVALAAPASAADLYGSDLNPAHQASSLSCPGYPCTVAQEHFANWESPLLPSWSVITGWKVKLSAGAQATLKILDTNYNDDYFASATGPTVTGNGGIVSVNTRVPLLMDATYAGIELNSGSVLTDRDTDYAGPSTMVFDRALANTGYQPDDHAEHELLSQVRVEPDRDFDGYGDETQDQCVGCAGPSNGPSDGPIPAPAPPDYDPTPVVPRQGDPYDAELAKRPPVKLTVDPRVLFMKLGDGTPVLRSYWANDGRYELGGSAKLLWGKKALKEKRPGFHLPMDDNGTDEFTVPKGLAKKLKRGRKVKLTLVVSGTAKNGTHATIRKPVTGLGRGATKAYDGTYQGTGGLKFVVDGGLVTEIHRDVNTFCPGSNKFVVRTLATAESFPALVGRGGAFKLRGDFGKDTVSYEGALTRGGSGKGKLSLFHTELTFGEGIGIDQCAGVSNWTAKRTAK